MTDMIEKDLKKPARYTIASIVQQVKDYGVPASALDYFGLDPDHTTISTLHRKEKELEHLRSCLMDDIRRYIYQFYARLEKAPLAFKHLVINCRIGLSSTDLNAVTTRLGDVKVMQSFNGAPVMERCKWDWDNAQVKIDKRSIFIEGKRREKDCLDISITTFPDNYGSTDDAHYSMPVDFLDPNYDYSSDPDFKDIESDLKVDSVYDEVFRHNHLEEERELLKVIASNKEVMKGLVKAIGKDKVKALRDYIED